MQAAQGSTKELHAARENENQWSFEVGDRVRLQGLTWKGSNVTKYYADKPLTMPLEEIHIDDKLQFVEEPVKIMEWEIKRC
ncbi:hypothetical protein Tco_0954953 [Tanacetum coccineum]|uniref:Uncharacterized protein n=1 Tax=Tanacetum coccineum TaxID=301880 RepID=A0ABQ5E5Y0_9ASTR